MIFEDLEDHWWKYSISGSLVELLHQIRIRQKARSRLAQIRGLGGHVRDSCDVQFSPSKNQTECHIIGSGWSLLEGIGLANASSAYVVGFNQAALCPLKYDFYFTEFAGPSVGALAEQQRRLIMERVLPWTRKVYFKGIWLKRNSARSAFEYFGDIATFVKDTLPVVENRVALPRVLNWLMTPESEFLRQYSSTALTCVAMAYRAGFKKIVLHGVDFGGAYFYELENIVVHPNLFPPSIGGHYLRSSFPESKATVENRNARTDLSGAMPLLLEYLGCRGVSIYSGSLSSPLSRFFPVYERR